MSKHIELFWIRECLTKNCYKVSRHADIERQNDKLKLVEIEHALLNGIIIEAYEDSGRGTSCLIAGFTDKGKPVHIVCGERNDETANILKHI